MRRQQWRNGVFGAKRVIAPHAPAGGQGLFDEANDDEAEDFGTRFASIRSRLLEFNAASPGRVDNVPSRVDTDAHRRRRTP